MTDASHTRRAPSSTDGVLLALLAAAWRIPALLAPTHLVFDDGVYGSALLTMRVGNVPFRDVWSPQGPAHLAVLWWFDLVGGRTSWSPRLGPVVAGVVVVLATHSFVLRVVGRVPAIASGVLVALTGSLAWVTGPITGDGPALAWAMVALAGTARLAEQPSTLTGLAVGVAAACALSTKILVAPVLLFAVAVVAPALRRDAAVRKALAAAAGSGVVVSAVWWTAFGFSAAWEQSIRYHTATPRITSTAANFHTLWSTLVQRDLVVLLALVGAAAMAMRRPLTGRHRTIALWCAAWAAATAVLLVVERAMFRAHVASVALALSVLVGCLLAEFAARPAARVGTPAVFAVLAIGCACALFGAAGVLFPRTWTPQERPVVDALSSLPSDALAISDEPGLVWRSGHRMPPWLDDPGIKRFATGTITTGPRSVIAALEAPDVCAVVVWSSRYATMVPGLHSALLANGYELTLRPGQWTAPDGTRGTRELWLRTCNVGTVTPDGAERAATRVRRNGATARLVR